MKVSNQVKFSFCLSVCFVLLLQVAQGRDFYELHQSIGLRSSPTSSAFDDTGNILSYSQTVGNLVVMGRNGGATFTQLQQIGISNGPDQEKIDVSGDGELITLFIRNTSESHKIYSYTNPSDYYTLTQEFRNTTKSGEDGLISGDKQWIAEVYTDGDIHLY